ncbi:MAG: flagellar basal body rod protein FlgB [Betaproteobacteria bacterium]|nr:flagellar basal body rod protein FlgB [Betaproteobacteria bacterium]
MINRIDQELSFSQTALNLRAYRQELLASNIANADTPNYKARDIDFKAALNGALGKGQSGALVLAQTSERHLPAAGSNRFGAAVQFRSEEQSNVDGNTVSMDVERAAFAENAIQMEAMLTFINGRFKTLNSAIQP